MNLVTVNHGEARTSTITISDNTENDHASVMKLVRNYQSDFEHFGIIGFEIQKSSKAGRPQEYATLNEAQTSLLFTYMRNTDVIREFKIRLIQEFITLRKQKTAGTLPPVVKEFNAAKQLAKALGLNSNQAILSANKAVHNITGINCIEYMGATHLLTSTIQELRMTPTQLGKRMDDRSPQQINKLLDKAGLQVRNPDPDHETRWLLTEEGKKYGEYCDGNKAQMDGKSIQYIAWYESVIKVIGGEA